MQRHGPKRIYSPQALEFWFGKLESDWSAIFTPAQLDEGRRIYRHSEVRELELTGKDAIIHRRVEKRDEYTVIEWENGTLNVRSSTTDTDAARALAVAGLHEIEELICDEIAPTPATESTVAPSQANGENDPAKTPGAVSTNGAANGQQTNGPHTNGQLAAATPSAPAAPARPLVLSFTAQIDGLIFQAHWNGTKDTRTPAFISNGNGNGSANTPAITSSERTKLIGLAAYARKAHFTYESKTGVYQLSAIAEIPSFLKNTLPAWRRLFVIELDEQSEKLMLTPRAIEIGVEATRRSRKKSAAPNGSGAPNGKTANGSALATDAALDLRWIFKAGERLLTDDEIALVTKRGTSPTLLPGVGIVSLPADRLDTLKNWQRNIAETQSADGTLPPYLVFSLFNDARLHLTLSPEIETWRQNVLTPAPDAPQLALPEILRPYQRRGVEWLRHLCDTGCHGLLADEMGLGKTLQTIALLTARPANVAQTTKSAFVSAGNSPRETPPPTLIVCPASVVPVWQEEFAKFSPSTRIEVLKTGNDFKTRQPALLPLSSTSEILNQKAVPGDSDSLPIPDNPSGVVWISSYAQLRKHRALLTDTEFAYAILDEGQFIKNPDAKTTQTCFAIRAAHRIVLSGTPLENRQLDLWSIFRFLLPGLLGTRAGFEAALAADREGTLTRIRTQLAPFILRRTKAEVASELPPKIEMELVCPLTDVQRAEYARVCSEGLERLGDDMDTALRERSFGFLALLTRLRQICCDPDMLPWLKSPLTDSGKINLLVEKLAEIISGGHKVVIFSQFVMLLDRVRLALAQTYPDLPVHEITGMTRDRLKPVQSFQTAKGAAAMLVSLKAGGTGITLHAADYIFLLDPWWNPAVEAQAVDRVHRIGQANTVFVYRMVTSGTIEERIQALKDSKRGLFDKLVGGLGGDFDLNQHFKSLHELVQLTTAEVVEQDPAAEYAFI